VFQAQDEGQSRIPLRLLVAIRQRRVSLSHRSQSRLPLALLTGDAKTGSTPWEVSTVGNLRSLATSSLNSLKRSLDALHGHSARDLEASHFRISKRIKMQMQSSLELAEKEHRKMFEKITERAEEMKVNYKKLMTEVQLSSSRVCKVTLPEMAKSVARVIDGLRSRYNIPPTRV
ncbi:uncharacterized protein LOC125507321, partial [Triticum urartu]|uniref:uncharacterized protein LOC125507321 n=1 Tax=Triticum urartu TaxID=4572 RepID=UPI0020447BE3